MGVKRGRKYAGYVARARYLASGPAAKRRRVTKTSALRDSVAKANLGIRRLTSMIETKEGVQTTGANISLPHNNIYVTSINPFLTFLGNSDPMSGTGNRIGDRITVRGLLLKGFFENALYRSRVHYRVMLVRGAKGETFSRATLFKGIVGNKLIDQMDTERFTIVASKRFTISTANSAAQVAEAGTGNPVQVATNNTGEYGGQGTKAWQLWIPGRKFGRGGSVQYENGSTSQVKFYDYRIVILAYDWFGTPQDTNNVGKINEMYCKIYFKDA